MIVWSQLILLAVLSSTTGDRPEGPDWQARHLLNRAIYLETQKGDVDQALRIYDTLRLRYPKSSVAATATQRCAAIYRESGDERRTREMHLEARRLRRTLVNAARGEQEEASEESYTDRLERTAQALESVGRSADAEALRARSDRLAYGALKDDQDRRKAERRKRSAGTTDRSEPKPGAKSERANFREVIRQAREEGRSPREIRQIILNERFRRAREEGNESKLEPERSVPKELRRFLRDAQKDESAEAGEEKGRGVGRKRRRRDI